MGKKYPPNIYKIFHNFKRCFPFNKVTGTFRSANFYSAGRNEQSQLHRLTRRLEESVWLPRLGKVSYIFRFDSPTDQLIELHPGVYSELETSI